MNSLLEYHPCQWMVNRTIKNLRTDDCKRMEQVQMFHERVYTVRNRNAIPEVIEVNFEVPTSCLFLYAKTEGTILEGTFTDVGPSTRCLGDIDAGHQ